MTVTAIAAPWFDSHENLYTLAQWLRETHGWNFCKDNLLDVLEKPWKWEKEWRLASGEVAFVEIPRADFSDPEMPERFGIPDANFCHWCDAAVGLVSYTSEFGPETEWITCYSDALSDDDLACEECAGQAANFVTREKAAADAALPELTTELREHFKAFDNTEVFPVVITRDVTTELGNVLIPADTRTWGARSDMRPFITVWTAHTHYAGIKTSSIPVDCFVRLAGETVAL